MKSGWESPDLIIEHASELLTLAPGMPSPKDQEGLVGIVPDGCVVCAGGRIVWAGPTRERPRDLAPAAGTQVIDATGRAVMPGLIDCHTHLVFGGDRAEEFAWRAAGMSYRDIAARGGGIAATVQATRRTPLDELTAAAVSRLQRMLAYGVTTVEVKSGYGLDLETEIKILRAIQALADLQVLDVVPTFLGAHVVPPEMAGRRERYVSAICDEMIPAVAEEGLARFCDVWVEDCAFQPDEARRILKAARDRDLRAKLHADQLTSGGGAELAAEMEAVSADHLEHVSDGGMAALARAGVTAVLLPGATFFTGQDRYAPGRRLREAGVEIALSTDCNPGTSMTEALPLMATIACVRMGLSPSECVRAMTLGAAAALGLVDRKGSLEPGKDADLLVLDSPDFRHLTYRFGPPQAAQVFKFGEEVYAATGEFGSAEGASSDV